MTNSCPTCGSPVRVVSADEGTSHYEPESALLDGVTADEIKALLWATAPYSDVDEIHESAVVGRSISLINSARSKLAESLRDLPLSPNDGRPR